MVTSVSKVLKALLSKWSISREVVQVYQWNSFHEVVPINQLNSSKSSKNKV